MNESDYSNLDEAEQKHEISAVLMRPNNIFFALAEMSPDPAGNRHPYSLTVSPTS